MTDNIQKLYEIAGVEKEIYCTGWRVWDEYHNCYFDQEDTCTKPKEYPPFTAEKQLELIKWLINYSDIHIVGTCMSTLNQDGDAIEVKHRQFEQALAGLILELWQDLTDAQKQEFKRILE